MKGSGAEPLRVPPADPFLTRWARRLVTIPFYVLLLGGMLAAFPLLLPVALLADVARGGPWVFSRCVVFFTWYLLCEVAGILTSLVFWIAGGTWAGARRARFLDWNFRLQSWWTAALLRGGERVFGLRIEVEGAEAASPGPILLFLRHASIADTVLASVFIARPCGIMLRYVIKRELLWDPCLDIVGNRLPNHFVRRGSGDTEREVHAVQRLLEGLGPKDGILLYPEGTRFTPAKQKRALARLREGGETSLYERAAALRHVLPPRPGGALGLLANNPGADVVFVAHTGFEAATSFHDFLGGSLVDAVVRMSVWRIPFAEIPGEREAQIEWLYDQWTRVDEWIESCQRYRNRSRTILPGSG